ncbi:MAG: TetR/AcrR family transcriptional regulator [Pseudomonadota bacterium]
MSRSQAHSSADAKRSTYHHGDLRRALLDAGEIELTEKGVEKFSLRGVAKKANVSHGAPAHHFDDVEGLLTALAARGYWKFLSAQEKRELAAGDSPRQRLAASGLGYIDFAVSNPALFRLMFASERTDKAHPLLAEAADAAFDRLVRHVKTIKGLDPHNNPLAMKDVLAAWAVAHGLADLMIAERLGRATFLASMTPEERDQFFSDIILRTIPDTEEHTP